MMVQAPSYSSSKVLAAWLVTPLILQTLLCLVVIRETTASGSQSVEFKSENAKDPSNLKDLHFVNRFMMPYGPDLYGRTPPQSSDDQPYAGYGYGMGAGEEIAYDYVNHYLYAATGPGYVIIVDYANPSNPVLTNLSFDLNGYDSSVESLQICPEQGYFFVLLGKKALITVFETVKRADPQKPSLYKQIQLSTDTLPSVILPNKACTMLAVGRENPGKGTSAQGGITLIRDFDTETQRAVDVPWGSWDDNYILRKGLHMPLTKNALKYWDTLSPIADSVDFSDLIADYSPGVFLHPKALAWSGVNDSELLVNLQENNGMLRIDVETGTSTAVVGFGLKDHSVVPVDINAKDKTCNLKTYKHLFSMKNPDGIVTLKYNDKLYVITANEGDSREFLEYEDRQKASAIFTGNTFALPNVEIPLSIFNPNNTALGSSALFNSECEGPECVASANIVLGSNAIDYESDPMHPIFHRMVLVGGRGWSIYELPEDPENLLKLVFDSGDAVESTGCQFFPWSHNAQQDEEYSPADNFPNNTLWQIADEELREVLTETNDPEQDGCIDRGDGSPGACSMGDTVDSRSAKDGSSIEQIVIGEACGRLVALMAVEKDSIAFLFDITDVATPSLVKVFHLSPASQFKSPGVAYNDGTLGEIDPENTFFLGADRSPTGKPSVVFVGAYSGTASYWEFECGEEGETDDAAPGNGEDNSSPSSNAAAVSQKSSMVWQCLSLATLFFASMTLYL